MPFSYGGWTAYNYMTNKSSLKKKQFKKCLSSLKT